MLTSDIYRDVFFSPAVHDILVGGTIIPPQGNARGLVQALLHRIAEAERLLGESSVATSEALGDLEDLIEAGVCILGSPLLTNVAFSRPTLSSCSAVPMPAGPFSEGHAEAAAAYYGLNMGSGYNLDAAEDPVRMLYDLNAHARDLTQQRSCERYIGNMAHLSVHHPQIRRFIAAKVSRHNVLHFNISIDVSEAFMRAVSEDSTYTLRGGCPQRAREVWDDLVSCAWACGDPGLISLERFNAGNALAGTSPYVTTAPCAEVGLAAGETCVFGYINLAACLKREGGALELDETLVTRAAKCLTRILDDAVEASLAGSPTAVTGEVMARNRKIGIGICGYADVLLMMELDYGSTPARALLNCALSTINFSSKVASMELAARRGSFADFGSSRYQTEPGFLSRSRAFASNPGADLWRNLERDVARWGLRNAMTTALPPSGRSALLLGVNSSIEPFLSLKPSGHGPLICRLLDHGPGAEAERLTLYRSAINILPSEHIAVSAEAAGLVDDSLSKTVNLRQDASLADVSEVFLTAWAAGLKGISVFRDHSLPLQAPARAA